MKIRIKKNFAWHKEGEIKEVPDNDPQTNFLIKLGLVEEIRGVKKR